MNPGDEPVLVGKKWRNVPKLSIKFFDMSNIIEEMCSIESRLSVLHKAQATPLAVHPALCKEATVTTSKLTIS